VLVAAVLSVAFLCYWVADPQHPAPSGQSKAIVIDPIVSILCYAIAGAVLIDRRPDLPFGWLLGGTAAVVGVAFCVLWPSATAVADGGGGDLAKWGLTASAFAFLPIAVEGIINVRFPSGRPASRRAAILELAIVVATVIAMLRPFLGATAISEVTGEHSDVRNPLTAGTTVGRLGDGLLIFAPIAVGLGLVAGVGVILRWRRARGLERQQLKWRAVGVIVSIALFPVGVWGLLSPAGGVESIAFVLTLTIPVLRYRLWAIDTIIRRSAAYAVVTLVVLAVYVAVAAGGARLISDRVAQPIAIALVVVLFAPLRGRVQRWIDRLFYGDRRDPYRTLHDLSSRLQREQPGTALQSVVETVSSSLRLPYVAIEHPNGAVLASSGAPGATQQRWPMTYDGAPQGYLVVSPRRGEDETPEQDAQVLSDVAAQASVVLRASALTTALVLSRQRLVSAREEERRRLRRELHDGLGPILTAIGLEIDVARQRLATGPDGVERHLADAKDATTQGLQDLRRVVHGLRPPALDDLGLVGALEAYAKRLRGADIQVDVGAADLPPLPAAVEVAAYRAAVEALTNAVRHGGAHRCSVRLSAVPGRQLILEITDDGTSAGPWTPGVGLTAMRERVAELGGTLVAAPTESGGRVGMRLPLVEERT
jgi:two-component system, NarL family, sensor kinase